MLPIKVAATSVAPINLAVEKATQLPMDLVDIIVRYRDLSSACIMLKFDKYGKLIDSEPNKTALRAMKAALIDPDCPRTIVNFIFTAAAHCPIEVRDSYGACLNKLMGEIIEEGNTINLDNTNLTFPDFSGLNLSGKFSAKNAYFFKPIFVNTNLDNLDLTSLDTHSPFIKGMSTKGTKFAECSLTDTAIIQAAQSCVIQ